MIRSMKHILNMVNILIVKYQDESSYTLHLAVVKCFNNKTVIQFSKITDNIDEIGNDLKKHPSEIYISGYGVITKNCETSSLISSKVKDEAENFLWTENAGRISFVREEQIKALQEQLHLIKAKIISVRCIENEVQDENVIKDYAKSYFSQLSLASVFMPTNAGSNLAMTLIGKVKFFILGLIFTLAASNAVLKPNVRVEYENIKHELEIRNNKRGHAVSVSKKKTDILESFNKKPQIPISVICDRIARILPTEMAFTEIKVFPPIKKIEGKELPEFRNDLLQISGHSKNSLDISNYVMELEKSRIISNASLSGVEFNDDSGLYYFSINIAL